MCMQGVYVYLEIGSETDFRGLALLVDTGAYWTSVSVFAEQWAWLVGRLAGQ